MILKDRSKAASDIVLGLIITALASFFVFGLSVPVKAAPAGCYARVSTGENIQTIFSNCPPDYVDRVNQGQCFVFNSSSNEVSPNGVETDCDSINVGSVPTGSSGNPCQLSESFLGIPTWYKYLEKQTDSTGRCNIVLSGNDAESKANSALPIGIAILEAVLRVAGLVAVVMIFWGGFKYITSQGNPDNAKGARTTVINAIIGLVIVITSTVIVSFIGRSL